MGLYPRFHQKAEEIDIKFDFAYIFASINYMPTLNIPKNLIREKELVVISKEEYDNLLKSRAKRIREVTMTAIQKRALRIAEKNLSKGKTLTIGELKQKLGIKS